MADRDAPPRRAVYTAFQGLLVAVLLLLLLYRRGAAGSWGTHLALPGVIGCASLILLRFLPESMLRGDIVPTALFIGDAAAASVILHWRGEGAVTYLLYVFILFGTALTRSVVQTLVVAAATSFLYVVAAVGPEGLPASTEFWLHLNFLWILTSLLAILAGDAQRARKLEEARARERTVRLESLAAMGQMAGEIAHRIKGPLTTIRVNAELLAPALAGLPEAAADLKQIELEAERCRTILKDLLGLGRIEEADHEPLDLLEPLRAALDAVAPLVRARRLRVELDAPAEAALVRGDRSLLYEALRAVLQNAVEASAEGARVWLAARAEPASSVWWRRSAARTAAWAVTVRDEGSGIRPEDIEAVFRPFYTTKGAEGSGLGLTAALRIMQKHGGSIEAASDGPGRGAMFSLRIPAA